MTPVNILDIKERAQFRQWLIENHATERECWVVAKRGKTPPEDALWYLDAVEEALCFGWIDSTLKSVNGEPLQRFGPRAKSGKWTELNKERCRRLEKLGLMTESGRKACPNLAEEFEIMPEIIKTFKKTPSAWENFLAMPPLYQRVRIDNIHRVKSKPELFNRRLQKLVEASAKGEMIGEWHDFGRLLDYGLFFKF